MGYCYLSVALMDQIWANEGYLSVALICSYFVHVISMLWLPMSIIYFYLVLLILLYFNILLFIFKLLCIYGSMNNNSQAAPLYLSSLILSSAVTRWSVLVMMMIDGCEMRWVNQVSLYTAQLAWKPTWDFQLQLQPAADWLPCQAEAVCAKTMTLGKHTNAYSYWYAGQGEGCYVVSLFAYRLMGYHIATLPLLQLKKSGSIIYL